MISSNKVRVWNLYRVSSQQQLHNKDDIPMQRNSCREYIDRMPGWTLTRELYEKAVSGWKNSNDDRDELQKIKEGAINGEFDILLVWYSDRLGRRAEETPLIISFLYQHNVKVWSVNEGELKAETHQDKLLTYIRFWQNEGESIKTSVRCKEALKQLHESGQYAGSIRF